MTSRIIPLDQKHAALALALRDVGTGRTLLDIANEANVSYYALKAWLLREVPDEYRELRELGLIQNILDADRELDEASNILEMQIADRKCKYARWDAERRLPHLFSQKQEIKHSGDVKVVFDLAETARRLAFVQASAARKLGMDLPVKDAELVSEPVGANDLF